MGTTTEKLTYLQGTKDAIKNAIAAKGVEVPEGTTFRGYAEKIGEIPTGPKVETVKVNVSGNGLYCGPVYYIDKELKPKESEGDLGSKPPFELEVLKDSVIFVKGGEGPDVIPANVSPAEYEIYSKFNYEKKINIIAIRATGDCTINC